MTTPDLSPVLGLGVASKLLDAAPPMTTPSPPALESNRADTTDESDDPAAAPMTKGLALASGGGSLAAAPMTTCLMSIF